ncbi:MAG TPA: riboflavin kinase [Elusimicrobiota bacterium]|nr:riboflavin kinase [Elusimicrobiota bacterium]
MDFVVAGTVVRGQGLGRQMGFPTANVDPEDGGRLPPRGVYRVEVSWNNERRIAACNVGTRPTLGEGGKTLVEVHIPGFSGDLYGVRIEVRFLGKIREEMKFDSLEGLRVQIAEDVASLMNIGSSPN